MKQFSQLSEQEILALAISLEEDDARIYSDYAKKLEVDYPASAKIFVEMAREEGRHRARLFDIYRQKFGEHIPLLRRQDVKGFITRRPVWMIEPLNLDKVRKQVEVMEYEARRFYEIAMQRADDASVRKLLGDLAEAERGHESMAAQLEERILDGGARNAEEETRRRVFVLRVVQPGLAGLMDGSVSTLAPLFAAAFATHSTWETFLVGLAASVGAGISMGFAEALSDDGSLTGRGHPLIRGIITGAMTALGGLGHTLPFLIENFRVATSVAFAVVAVELWVIAWIRSRYMDTPFLQAAFEVVLGGVIVFAAGILIGSA
jgi:erythrin-vacuolar iron transport family protein